jgi:hypothetical protein
MKKLLAMLRQILRPAREPRLQEVRVEYRKF